MFFIIAKAFRSLICNNNGYDDEEYDNLWLPILIVEVNMNEKKCRIGCFFVIVFSIIPY